MGVHQQGKNSMGKRLAFKRRSVWFIRQVPDPCRFSRERKLVLPGDECMSIELSIRESIRLTDDDGVGGEGENGGGGGTQCQAQCCLGRCQDQKEYLRGNAPS